MLTQEERIIGQMLCTSPMAQGVGTGAIAQRLGIRNDQAAYTLCRMRQKGYVFTKTAESTAMGYSVWHCTRYFSEELAPTPAIAPKPAPDTKKRHYRIHALYTPPVYLKCTRNDALERAKTVANKSGATEVWELLGTMKYIPPQPMAGTYELE